MVVTKTNRYWRSRTLVSHSFSARTKGMVMNCILPQGRSGGSTGGTSRINARTMFKTEALSPSEATTISAIAGPLPLPKVFVVVERCLGAVVLG